MNILVLYNSGEAQSILSSFILKNHFTNIGDTVTMVDLLGKSDAAMDTAIDNSCDDASQDRVYCTTVVDATHTTDGHPSTDVNIATADDKIVASPEIGYDATVEIGENDGTATPVLQAWNECYSDLGWPNVVRYLSGTYFPYASATADSAGAASLTDASAFGSTNSKAGKYVYIISATTGFGQLRRIVSNTANALTVAAWDTTPTGTIVYGIVDLEDEAFRKEALEYYISGYLFNLNNRESSNILKRLIDMGSYDPTYNSIDSGALIHPTTDTVLLEEIVNKGKEFYQSSLRKAYVTSVTV